MKVCLSLPLAGNFKKSAGSGFKIKDNLSQNNYPKLNYLQKDTISFGSLFKPKKDIDKVKYNEIKKKLKEQGVNFKTCSTEQLFNAVGLKFRKNKDGKLILNEYKQPAENLKFSDLEIDENKFFSNIVAIEGDADFRGSEVTNLGNLKKIGGSARFSCSKVKNLGKLEYIAGFAFFRDSYITNLKNLQEIGEDADFSYSDIENFNKLKIVGGSVDIRKTYITNLGELQHIGGNLRMSKDSSITKEMFEGIVQGEIIEE